MSVRPKHWETKRQGWLGIYGAEDSIEPYEKKEKERIQAVEARAFSLHPIYFISALKVRLEFLGAQPLTRACGLGLKQVHSLRS